MTKPPRIIAIAIMSAGALVSAAILLATSVLAFPTAYWLRWLAAILCAVSFFMTLEVLAAGSGRHSSVLARLDRRVLGDPPEPVTEAASTAPSSDG